MKDTSNSSQPAVLRRSLLAAMLAAPVMPALAQFKLVGVGAVRMPFGIAPFRGEDNAPEKISQIIQADLERSGRFVPVGLASSQMLDETVRPDLAPWKLKDANRLIVGSVTRLSESRYDVRFRLWDVVKGEDLGGQSFVVAPSDLRLAAHRIADFVYEQGTGERGVFSTRIAYVSQSGNTYNLWVADSDGENARAALSSHEPIISPAWSPNGESLAYVSFESRKPVVYVHDVRTAKRRLLANFHGSNSAPAWSVDGSQLAVTLSRDGGSQLYLINAAGGEPRRLMSSMSIDTEPAFSPDGQYIYFVSDRGGSPQIYRTGAGGGDVQRVTFDGNYNISPAPSPDGRHLAFVTRQSGAFRLAVMDLQSRSTNVITDTASDESPSFAPNSRLIVYATRQNGREALMTTTLDGQIKTQLAGKGGEIREPAWGPFIHQN